MEYGALGIHGAENKVSLGCEVIQPQTQAGGKEKEWENKRVMDKDKEKERTSGSKRSREDKELASGVADSVLQGKLQEMKEKNRVVPCEACKRRKQGLQYCLKRGCR